MRDIYHQLLKHSPDFERYSNEDARRDLVLMGNALRHLPRMAQALEQSANTAHYVLKERREASQ